MAPFGPLYFLEKHPRQPASSGSRQDCGSAPQRVIDLARRIQGGVSGVCSSVVRSAATQDAKASGERCERDRTSSEV